MNRSVRVFVCVFLSVAAYSLLPESKAAADPQHYYYCEPTNSFFPYVQTCTAPWKEFDPKPAAAPAPAADPTPKHTVVAYPIGMPPPQPQPAVATTVEPAVASAVIRGAVVFVFGAETPTIVCAVAQLCDIALQAGERVNQIILGDSEHWHVDLASEGSGSDETAHLIIRTGGPDLDTSMIVLTRRRTYHMRLVSHRKDNMLQVVFTYPEQTHGAKAAEDDVEDGLVKVEGVTYVKGREPKGLVPKGKPDEPPMPATAPARTEITTQQLLH